MAINLNRQFKSDSILVDANNLRHTNLQKRMLAEYITDILYDINKELKTAHKEGEQDIHYSLPIMFQVPNMDNKVCQRIVWASIFSQLINKNYRVEWTRDPKNSNKILMRISWATIEDECLVDQQLNLIKQCYRSD